MVGRQTLDLSIGVRIPVPQPRLNSVLGSQFMVHSLGEKVMGKD